MSHMLDALKKLEATSGQTPSPVPTPGHADNLMATLALPIVSPSPAAQAKPAAGQPGPSASADIKLDAPARAKIVPRPVAPARTPITFPPLPSSPTASAAPIAAAPTMAKPTAANPPSVSISQHPAPRPVAPTPNVTLKSETSVAPLSETALPAPRQQPTALEQAVRAALADPTRAVPLEQLARRLRNELRADSGRCWLLAAAGEHNDTGDLAAHLGAIFAGQLGDTLLIDANVEQASLSLGLDATNRPGLGEIVLQNRPWQNLVLPTSWPHLFLLPAGHGLTNRHESSDHWANLLAQAERRFRLVLLDGGAASGHVCGAISRCCDATYLVIRLGLTETHQAREAIAQFRSRGARILGTIATSVPAA